jgi:hypothetical protein
MGRRRVTSSVATLPKIFTHDHCQPVRACRVATRFGSGSTKLSIATRSPLQGVSSFAIELVILQARGKIDSTYLQVCGCWGSAGACFDRLRR